MADTAMTPSMNPAATDHLPSFVSLPGQPDTLFYIMLAFLVVMVVLIGTFYLKLHALPEHIAHRGSKVQYEVVAILALLALFTHNAIFWIAALLLATIDLPNIGAPLYSMARSLKKISGKRNTHHEATASPGGAAVTTRHPFPWQSKG